MTCDGGLGKLESADIDALLRGLEIFGTGGGGSVGFGRAIMENDFARGREYELIELPDVPDNALIVSGGIMGSVKVLDRFPPEEIVSSWEEQFEPMLALRAMEKRFGRKVDFLVPFELGGLNTPVILSLAARAGIPIINGDGVGRAAPETQMTSFIGHGVSLTPMPLVDWKGNTVIVEDSASIFFPDEVGRFVVTRAGGLGANSHYAMDGTRAKLAVIPGTIGDALRLGRAVGDIADPSAIVEHIGREVGAKLAFAGRVEALREEEAMGFLVQTASIAGSGHYEGQILDVVMKNEFMMASKGDSIGCMFPDLILMVDDRGRGVMSADLKEGQDVHVLVGQCHSRLREAVYDSVGREALGPGRYGRPDLAYRPVEELSSEWGLTWAKS